MPSRAAPKGAGLSSTGAFVRYKIKHLEKIARQLEPEAQQRRALLSRVEKYTEEFLGNLDDARAYRADDRDGSELFDAPIGEQPAELDDMLTILRREVDTPGINPASGGHLGYIPGGGLYHSALGDFLADVTNRYAGVAFASPGAVRLENQLIDWMAGLVGFPETAGGDLTSGGSIANLMGIVCARDAKEIRAADHHRSPIYLTAQVHHCVDKALRIAGLAECPRRIVPMDGRYRMRPGALERLVQEDKKAGLNPWLVVATAGTTDVGAVDPLDDLADIAAAEGLWFHVDGAYGGFFVLCGEGRKTLRGIDRADSLVMDPHKSLFLPWGSGALLVRDVADLHRSHYYQANYMQDATESSQQLSPADLSPELTRPFRGLRLWMPLKLVGLAPFRAALSEKLALARHFHDRLQEAPGFEVGPCPDLSVVTYRYVPKQGDPDAFNRALVEAIREDGRIFISSTMLDGKFVLRMAAVCFRTHLDTIELALDLLKTKAAALEAGGTAG